MRKRISRKTLGIYNKYDVYKTSTLLNICIVSYTDSWISAFISIYHNHWWFALLGNLRGFGREERGNARWFQRRHCAKRYGLQGQAPYYVPFNIFSQMDK